MRMVVTAGLIVALTSGVTAQNSERPSVEGAKLYTTYCADCHGKDGKGPGQLAQLRGISVPDLQLMARRNRGVFPLGRVEKLLSGTERPPVVHGGIEMPLWGRVLSDADGKGNFRIFSPNSQKWTLPSFFSCR